MDKLTVIEHNGKFVVDSRDVAEMVGKEHAHLMRDIRGYVKILNNRSNFGCVDFFIPHNYKDGKGETRPCFFITRKGCDMVANKMTGEKGVLFTAAYVTKFEEMERQLKQPHHKIPQTYAEALQAAADLAKENEKLLPKAEYFDELVERGSLMSFRDTAKELHIKESDFISYLIKEKYIFRNNRGRLRPHTEHVPELFELKEFSSEKSNYTGTQTLITCKGRDKFRREIRGGLVSV